MPAKHLGMYYVHRPTLEMMMHTRDSGLGSITNGHLKKSEARSTMQHLLHLPYHLQQQHQQQLLQMRQTSQPEKEQDHRPGTGPARASLQVSFGLAFTRGMLTGALAKAASGAEKVKRILNKVTLLGVIFFLLNFYFTFSVLSSIVPILQVSLGCTLN
ncbi:unnamed protein product [Protopolystoma xenopodis]|uniref:Uncharacterized protein n=1 Tax=Protopolystoma xenopodis TaxID=117903 RepID=A0A3S5AB86_9PLAT|nr:unnamed protein product [Protopolystoma xenopodis]